MDTHTIAMSHIPLCVCFTAYKYSCTLVRHCETSKNELLTAIDEVKMAKLSRGDINIINRKGEVEKLLRQPEPAHVREDE